MVVGGGFYYMRRICMMKQETVAYPANVTLVKPFLVRQEMYCSSYRIYFSVFDKFAFFGTDGETIS